MQNISPYYLGSCLGIVCCQTVSSIYAEYLIRIRYKIYVFQELSLADTISERDGGTVQFRHDVRNCRQYTSYFVWNCENARPFCGVNINTFMILRTWFSSSRQKLRSDSRQFCYILLLGISGNDCRSSHNRGPLQKHDAIRSHKDNSICLSWRQEPVNQ